jgi:hypothetical protein
VRCALPLTPAAVSDGWIGCGGAAVWGAGVLRLELVELLASLSTALVGAMHGMDAEFSQTEEDHAKVKAAYSEMFEDKQLLMDRSTFLALAKLISAQLIVSASVNSGQSFVYDEPVKSTVTIEEIPEGDE